ncbi:MAG: AAA family ATPase [Bacilli bacterium]|nr:ATP-binding protein [Bacilli bacterium]MDD7315540.1 AAA family ATPase [Bacilli bacterium]
MKVRLIRIETSGMKNIQNLITIDFRPQTVDNISSKMISNVKSIYGINGSGKSAIINSVSLYKQLTLNSNLLKQTSEIIKLNKIINKITKEFYISLVYELLDSKNTKSHIYKNELTLKLDNEIPYIESEKLSMLKDQSINGNYSIIYEVNNGILNINNSENTLINEFLVKHSLNILRYSTLTALLKDSDFIKGIGDYISDNKEQKVENLGVIEYLFINRFFANNITIYLDEKDIHTEYSDDDIENLMNVKLLNISKNFIRNTLGSKKDVIRKNNLDKYKDNVNNLYKFLKLFKPNLKEIKIETTEDENYYYCSKKMVYENYEVDSEYESTGIQKLMSIYNSLSDVVNGKIVFIDELDANINGVYLNALIEYLNKLNSGQLCFTTHNLTPMEYLYKYSNSIDFIGETGKLVSWKKNGNYKPYKQYPEGMIVDSPFNIDALDFINVFE